MIPAKPFYMIRHGETQANKDRVMAGSIDSPLTQRGRDQAYAIHDILAHLPVPPVAIAHSHLSRARDTAEIINQQLDLPMIEDADLAELHTGDWEGASYDECRSILHSWDTPPNGESFEEFITRLSRAKNKLLDAHDGPVLIVCHGGVFRAFGKMYGLNSRGVENCHMHEFEPHQDRPWFPWKVWQYDLSQCRAKAAREKAETYESALAAMAS